MYNPNMWWHVIQFVVMVSLPGLFIYKIFEHHLRVNKVTYCVAILIYAVQASIIIVLSLTEISPYKNFQNTGTIMIIITSIIMIKLIVKGHTFALLFLFFLFLNVQYNVLSLAKATVQYNIMPRIISYEWGDVLTISLLYIAMIFPVLYYLLIKLYKRVIDEEIGLKGMEFFFCLPAGFVCSIYMFMRLNYQRPIGDIKGTLIPLLAINICAFGSYFAVLKSVIASHDAEKKRQQLYVSELQQQLLQERCENLQQKISLEARARHDWKHHVITILGLVDKQDMEELKRYLGEYNDKYVLEENMPLCDVPAIDMLLQYYKRRAQELDIGIDINGILLAECRVDILDFIVLFGNLLSNAIEAARSTEAKEKYISLKIKNNYNHTIGIICENNFDGIVERKNGKIISRKEDGGVGLSSIEAVVCKYDGTMKVDVDAHVFKVYVALNGRE